MKIPWQQESQWNYYFFHQHLWQEYGLHHHGRKSISGCHYHRRWRSSLESKETDHRSTINTWSGIYCSNSLVRCETNLSMVLYRSLLTELKISLTTPSTIFSDNQSAISIAHHPEFHARTKQLLHTSCHIAVHFLRGDHVKKGALDLCCINTEYNLADIFTKALKKPSHINFTHELGVLS